MSIPAKIDWDGSQSISQALFSMARVFCKIRKRDYIYENQI